MAIKFHPEQGSILVCDFKGLQEPEITKRRPVLVISPKLKNRGRLCTVVPFSTTPPRPVEAYHCRLLMDQRLPLPYDNEWQWVKADLVYTVAFDRLSLMQVGKDAAGKRIYDQRVVPAEILQQVQHCLRCGLGL